MAREWTGRGFASLLCLLLPQMGVSRARAEELPYAEVAAFFGSYCTDCHGSADEAPEAGLALSEDWKAAALKDSESERLPFDKSYLDTAAGEMPVQLRMSAREYGAKYAVLLPDAGLPADSRAEHGFTNRGDAQNLSAAGLEQYLHLAREIAFHPELLSRGERLQELFPNAVFRAAASTQPDSGRIPAVVTAAERLAPQANVRRTAEGSPLSLAEFRQQLAAAFEEDRGGVYDAEQNKNATIAGKGGLLRIAYGKNANRLAAINPDQEIWIAPFATAEESSGETLFCNRQKDQKQFMLTFQRGGDELWKGLSHVGVVLLSRRGEAGMVRLTAEYDNGDSRSLTVELAEGAGSDNVFFAFAAPSGAVIRRLAVDGSAFSGPYVLLDDLAFLTRDAKYFETISWHGPGYAAPALKDPGEVFQRLFGKPDPMTRSILDAVREDAGRLQLRLGAADRVKLDEYLDSVRGIERRIQQSGDLDGVPAETMPRRPAGIPEDRGEYLRLMADLIVAAFQQDRSRVATLLVDPERWDTPRMYHGVFDSPQNHHVLTHTKGEEAKEKLQQIDRFHVDQFAYLVRRMQETDDGDGSLLDNSLITLGSGMGDGRRRSGLLDEHRLGGNPYKHEARASAMHAHLTSRTSDMEGTATRCRTATSTPATRSRSSSPGPATAPGCPAMNAAGGIAASLVCLTRFSGRPPPRR